MISIVIRRWWCVTKITNVVWHRSVIIAREISPRKSCRTLSIRRKISTGFHGQIVVVVRWRKVSLVGTRIFSVRYRAHQVFIPGTVLQCAQQLEQKTPQYLWHVFVKRKQSVYFEDMKGNGGNQTVICQVDYAENFAIHDQDQIQSAHWSLKQVSIFTSYTCGLMVVVVKDSRLDCDFKLHQAR